jgi:hypothetical protein
VPDEYIGKVKRIGAWGKTLFWLKLSPHIEGTMLQLQQRTGSVGLLAEEVRAVCAFAQAVGIEPDPRTTQAIRERLGLP